MAENENKEIVLKKDEIVPNIDPRNHAVTTELWQSLVKEVEKVSEEINSGVELKPQDVKRAQSLHKQVGEYVTGFNRTMRSAQKEYKASVEERLKELGYGVIENYVQEQRQKQTDEQNKRSSDKLDQLTKIVEEEVSNTIAVKNTVLEDEMFPAFYDRFPIIKSGAKNKMITDWEPYRQVVKTNLEMVDSFLQDEKYQVAQRLPIHSKTMQQLLQYIRTGDIEKLANMKDIFMSDRGVLEDLILKENLKTQKDAIDMIGGLISGDTDNTEETLINISKVVAIALTL